MTMKAVGTAAMEMVQEVEIQFDEVRGGTTEEKDQGVVLGPAVYQRSPPWFGDGRRAWRKQAETTASVENDSWPRQNRWCRSGRSRPLDGQLDPPFATCKPLGV